MEALDGGFGHLRRFQSSDRAVLSGVMRPEMRPWSEHYICTSFSCLRDKCSRAAGLLQHPCTACGGCCVPKLGMTQ
jgi:hypothetical protein